MVARPKEIAAGVYWLPVRWSNIYFVRSDSWWVVIDAGWANSGRVIREAAEMLFGMGARPAAILLTHDHPDHAGSALELARMWDVPVYVSPSELPLMTASMTRYADYPAGPLDRWVILPMMRRMPAQALASIRAQDTALRDATRALDLAAGVPGLPDWRAVPAPGHTPGHIAFFRERDGALISGDALMTMNFNSVWDLLRGKRRVSGPPYLSTWDWHAGKESVATLARLEPRVLASGHGAPMTGPGVAQEIRAFAEGFSGAPTARRPADMSLAERIVTFVEHQLDTRLEGLGVGLYRLTRGRVAGVFRAPGDVLILTTRGRKSGKERSVMLLGFRDGADMIVVAANTGEPRHPGWYYNLKATPWALVEMNGFALDVRAEELVPDEAAAFWPRVVEVAPAYARYPKRTTRPIPLMRLIPAARAEERPISGGVTPQAEKAGV